MEADGVPRICTKEPGGAGIGIIPAFIAAPAIASGALVRLFSDWRLVDAYADRTVHAVPTPTMGGLAMYAGFIVAMGIYPQRRWTALEAGAHAFVLLVQDIPGYETLCELITRARRAARPCRRARRRRSCA